MPNHTLLATLQICQIGPYLYTCLQSTHGVASATVGYTNQSRQTYPWLILNHHLKKKLTMKYIEIIYIQTSYNFFHINAGGGGGGMVDQNAKSRWHLYNYVYVKIKRLAQALTLILQKHSCPETLISLHESH